MLGTQFPARKIVSLAILSALLFSFLAVIDSQPFEEEPKDTYTIYVGSGETRSLVKEVDLVESYDSFVLARLSDSEVLELENKGIEVIREHRLSTIALDGFVFDTEEGAPEVPEFLQVKELSDGRIYSFLLQFVGPIKTEWIEELESRAIRILDYIPYNAFLIRMTPEKKGSIERLPFVQWIGFYEPMYRVRPSLWSMTEETLVEVILYKEASDSAVLSLIGDKVVDSYSDGEFNIVEANIDASYLPALAKLNEVLYIEPVSIMIPFNYNAQAVFQTNRTSDDPAARKIWDMGLDGTGQVITVADTGLDYDHAMFRQSNEITWIGDIYNVTDMNRRKLVRYFVMRQIAPELDPWAWKDSAHRLITGNITSGHGTSVAAAAVGHDDSMGMSQNDGMAKGAKLIIQDIGTVCRNSMHSNWWDDCLNYIPNNYTYLFLPAYLNGSRIHSNSWGAFNSDYDRKARMVDTFMWNYPDMVIAFANGNGGPCSWGMKHNTGSPATAKNLLSVGMTEGYPNQHNVSCGSSPGPTADGRMKPTVLAFGSGKSAWSSGNPYDEFNISSEGWFGGSSYATPLTSGMAAIVRQYFEEGWYPGGTPLAGNGFSPSAALVKAMIITSGQEMTGNNSDMLDEGLWPNDSQGWGRPLLDDVLYFPGERRKITIRDSETIDYTGQQKNYSFIVKSGAEPLKISLVWTDYPASFLSFQALVNDLNLLVIDPLGNEYKGNVFWTYADSTPGESKPNSGVYDVSNPVEGVVVKNPVPGEWTLRVIGYDIPKAPQPFAFVVNGIVKQSYYPPIGPPTNVWAELDGLAYENVTISWGLSSEDPGSVDHYSIYYDTEFDEDGIGYDYLGQVPAGINSYIHVGAGYGDLNNYYYYVQSNSTGIETGRSLEQVGKFARNLDGGMQLVSIPLEQKDDSVETVLQTIWDSFESVQYYDSNQRIWKTLWKVKPWQDISTLNHVTGFWIKMTAPDVLVVAGRVADNVPVQLLSGWNLVGYPCVTNSTISESLYSVSFSRIEGYDNRDPYYLQRLSENSILEPGYGYWVYVETDQVWTVFCF